MPDTGAVMYLYLIQAPAAFLAGAFPTSYLAGKLLKGLDLREHGSGNLGATNVFRVMGAWPAVLVLAVDIFKGFAAVSWLPRLAVTDNLILLQVILGLAAVAGHIFSPFVGFRGGKGVATAAGVFLAICPLAVLYCLAVWGAVFALFRIVSVASLAAALCLPLFVRLTVDPALPGFAVISSFSYGIALAVILTHRSNIGRLFRGQEKRLSRGGGEPK